MDYQEIFEYFSKWVTAFEIDGCRYGGERDVSKDPRILEFDKQVSLNGKRILELGPLEAGHTLLFSRLGAREIISIEGRAENYLKCCAINNIFDLNQAKVLLGDLRSVDLKELGHFDICSCLGVLYHLVNPALLIQNIAEVCDHLMIWTHVAGDKYPPGNKISNLEAGSHEYRGKMYQEALHRPQAGLQNRSFWPFEDELLRMLEHAGFAEVKLVRRGELYDHAQFCLIHAHKN